MIKSILDFILSLFKKPGPTTTVPPMIVVKPEEPKKAIQAKAAWDNIPEGKMYTIYTMESLWKYGGDLLAVTNVSDSEIYCALLPKMTKDQRLSFWVALISCMAERESNFKTQTSYKEGFDDSKGDAVISRGLMQLSLESVNQKAYGGNVKRAEDLHDPKINLECAVKILNYWIPKDGFIGTAKYGGARYWATLRDHSDSKPKIIAKLKKLGY
jgi:hypothetical protein